MIKVINNPSLKLVISGDNISPFLNSYSWEMLNKAEDTISIVGTAPVAPSTVWTQGVPYSLQWNNITGAYFLFIYGDGTAPFNINITQTQDLMIGLPPVATPTDVTFTITNDGTAPTILPLSDAFLTSLKGISISTNSSTSVQVFAGIYSKNPQVV